MTWLKEWDQCVFKRRVAKGKKRGWDGEIMEVEENLDPMGRPKEKVRIFLSFPLSPPTRARADDALCTDPAPLWTSWIRKDHACSNRRDSGWIRGSRDQRQVRRPLFSLFGQRDQELTL